MMRNLLVHKYKCVNNSVILFEDRREGGVQPQDIMRSTMYNWIRD